MKNPFQEKCFGSFGGPVQPFMIIGRYKNEEYLTAGSLVITYIINNYLNNNKEPIRKAMVWEAAVLDLLTNYTSDVISVYYTTERSIEDELDRESKADIKIIAISYLMMFVYLTVTLGKYSSWKLSTILLEMKISLGLAGVVLVLLSVFSSGGLFTYLGVPATLITLEVIPFLLLAVGVDNIYVMVQTYQNDERLPNESIEDQISRIVGKVGPSMLLTGTTQSAAFLISALTPMPGVRAFSLYASLAIILNFIMQVTCFVVLLTLDAKREQSQRLDVFCCFKLELKDPEIMNKKSSLYRFFKNYYTPIILNDYVRAIVIVVFVGFFFACISMCDKIKVGLDQKLAMPTDSYQIHYFEALQKHLAVGPPVYFVVKDGFNYTDTNLLRRLCGSSSCESNSLQSLLSSASFYPNETFIAQSSVNWIDDYMEWLSADTDKMSCCFVDKNESKFCDRKKLQDEFYKKRTNEARQALADCVPCTIERTAYNFPSQKAFLDHVTYFLNQNPSADCIKAGHAMYGSSVKLNKDKYKRVTEIGGKFSS
jgi:Niemann-Pick C1 protein